MRIIICDRCGKKINKEDIRKTMTISRALDQGKIKVVHCDRIRLMSEGDIQTDIEIDLCDKCKESFVDWFGKAGIYER